MLVLCTSSRRLRLRMHVYAYVVVKTRLKVGLRNDRPVWSCWKAYPCLTYVLGFSYCRCHAREVCFPSWDFELAMFSLKYFNITKVICSRLRPKLSFFFSLFHIFVVRLSVLCAEGSSILISQSTSKHSFTAVTALWISKSDPLVTVCVEAPCKLTSLVSPCTSCAVVIKSNRQRQLIRGLLRKSIAKRKKTTK